MIKKFLVVFAFGTVCFVAGNLWDYPVKLAISYYYQNDFGQHVYQCDNAMREHFIAKSRVGQLPSAEAVQALNSAEVGLIDCHEYDKFRKKLLSLGLNDSDLASMGLVAIERKKADLQTLVREHEIRY